MCMHPSEHATVCICIRAYIHEYAPMCVHTCLYELVCVPACAYTVYSAQQREEWNSAVCSPVCSAHLKISLQQDELKQYSELCV